MLNIIRRKWMGFDDIASRQASVFEAGLWPLYNVLCVHCSVDNNLILHSLATNSGAKSCMNVCFFFFEKRLQENVGIEYLNPCTCCVSGFRKIKNIPDAHQRDSGVNMEPSALNTLPHLLICKRLYTASDISAAPGCYFLGLLLAVYVHRPISALKRERQTHLYLFLRKAHSSFTSEFPTTGESVGFCKSR